VIDERKGVQMNEKHIKELNRKNDKEFSSIIKKIANSDGTKQ
jgi:hypothetical protein